MVKMGSGASLNDATSDAGGLAEPPSDGQSAEPPADGALAEAPADGALAERPAETAPVAAASQSRPLAAKAVPSAYWITLGVGAMMMAVFYLYFTFARLEIFKMLLGSLFPLAFMILTMLGSIVFGLATPTEAAAMGAIGSILLAIAYLHFTYGMLRESAHLTTKTTAMVCWLFVGSSIFSAAFALLGGQELINTWVLSMNLTPVQFMILAQGIIFLLGWLLEWTEIIVTFMPIFIPFLSPPVAMPAFYLKGVAPPHVTLHQIFLGMMPFMAIQVLGIVLLYIIPAIGLWLPEVLYK